MLFLYQNRGVCIKNDEFCRQLHRRHVTMLSASVFAFPRATMAYVFLFEGKASIDLFGQFERALSQMTAGVQGLLGQFSMEES